MLHPLSDHGSGCGFCPVDVVWDYFKLYGGNVFLGVYVVIKLSECVLLWCWERLAEVDHRDPYAGIREFMSGLAGAVVRTRGEGPRGTERGALWMGRDVAQAVRGRSIWFSCEIVNESCGICTATLEITAAGLGGLEIPQAAAQFRPSL